jgi:DNA cross-link repair 1A protein
MAAQDADIKLLKDLSAKFIVDGFNFTRSDVKHYFLTHYHSDHTCGLNAGFKAGIIYTSSQTRSLLVHDMGVRPELVEVLPMNETVIIEGIEVTALDAFHCPGAIMIHFYDRQMKDSAKQQPLLPPSVSSSSLEPVTSNSSRSIQGLNRNKSSGKGCSLLHVGDFRADHKLVNDAILHERLHKCGGLDVLYLDTTYCNPKYTFPPQKEVSVCLFVIIVCMSLVFFFWRCEAEGKYG